MEKEREETKELSYLSLPTSPQLISAPTHHSMETSDVTTYNASTSGLGLLMIESASVVWVSLPSVYRPSTVRLLFLSLLALCSRTLRRKRSSEASGPTFKNKKARTCY